VDRHAGTDAASARKPDQDHCGSQLREALPAERFSGPVEGSEGNRGFRSSRKTSCMPRVSFSPAIAAAIAAALLFGVSTPIAKQLLHDTPPILLAGLPYFGSGIGLGLIRTARDHGWRAPSMAPKQWPSQVRRAMSPCGSLSSAAW
jgi:hypothetical protein